MPIPPPSHTYDFQLKECLSIALPPFGLLGIFAVLLHLSANAKLLPAPCPALDIDRTILIHQAEASRQRRNADLVLIGDSSCLMDVSVDQLHPALPPGRTALNLGSLSYLDLKSFSSLITNYAHANPGVLRTVVLLMHPEALRRPSPTEYHTAALRNFLAGKDYCGPAMPHLLCALGVETFRARILSRALPQALPGPYGQKYGFTQDLWDYLSAHKGSLLDPGELNPTALQGNAEYRLAKSLETASRLFKQSLPRDTELLVGITPVPEAFAGDKYAPVHGHLLETWSAWLGAIALDELPATFPERYFASATHLNAAGVDLYTARLAKALKTRFGNIP